MNPCRPRYPVCCLTKRHSHAPSQASVSSLLSHKDASHMHPAVLQLGLRYADGSIKGATARCLAMLHAFCQVCTHVWTIVCVDDCMCGRLYVWTIVCVDDCMCGRLYVCVVVCMGVCIVDDGRLYPGRHFVLHTFCQACMCACLCACMYVLCLCVGRWVGVISVPVLTSVTTLYVSLPL
jgi:hypothetical protein